MGVNQLEVQFDLTHDCIRACVYADYIARVQPRGDAWPSICDTLYADAILSWNHLFGTNSQESHWKKWVERAPVPTGSRLKPFAASMIAQCLNTTLDDWAAYHAQLVDLRNNRIAHFDWKVAQNNLPNLTWAMHSAYLYRDWLLQLLQAYRDSGIALSIADMSSRAMLEMFKTQIAEICGDADPRTTKGSQPA